MLSNKDYAKMTQDELVAEEKKVKSQKTLTVLLVIFFVGTATWTATHNGGFLVTVSMLVFAGVVGSSYTKKAKNIQAELSRRNTGR